MGANTSKNNSRGVGSLLRLPKLQDNLKKVYKYLNPTANAEKVRAFVRTLNTEDAILSNLDTFELQIYGRNPDGSAKVTKGNDLYQRAQDLADYVKTHTVV